jgi:hypothetical protein
MAIKDATGADPISIDVLRLACVAALKLGPPLLWLDGLCIVQRDENDKAWQIQSMHDIYKLCKTCLILPGGLSRLVAIDEETRWIHRAWTLQEAVAPLSCFCLFSWSHGDCVMHTIVEARITEVEPEVAAMCDMLSLLRMSGTERNVRYPDPETSARAPPVVDVRLLCNDSLGSFYALHGAIIRKGKEVMGCTIWRAALLRFSSRPVDFIFSIMGLLGVALDPSLYAVDDKTAATVALMQALLRQGQSPEGLGIIPMLWPGGHLTTLLEFPEPDSRGRASFSRVNGAGREQTDLGYLAWWL